VATDDESLGNVYEAVLARISELGLTHYPSSLGLGERNAAAVLAFWTKNDDWQQFVKLASAVGAPVVYADLAVLSEADMPREEDDTAEAELLSAHIGEPFRLTVAYAAGPVVHLWIREAAWWLTLGDELDELDEEESRRDAAILARSVEEGWAQKIAEDPRYYSAKRVGSQLQAVNAIVEELLGESGQGLGAHRFGYRLHDQAAGLVEDARARVEERALAAVPLMVSQLTAANADWYGSTYGIRRSRAKRLVECEWGMPFPGVVDEVARWTAEKQRQVLLERAAADNWATQVVEAADYRSARNEEDQRQAISGLIRDLLGLTATEQLDNPTSQVVDDLLKMSWENGGPKILS